MSGGVRDRDVRLVRDEQINFVKLENPPAYEPTKCARCRRVIRRAEDLYSMKGGRYYCD
jgi:hypothetical protein